MGLKNCLKMVSNIFSIALSTAVRSDPNFLGPSTSPLINKPTGVVQPSPKISPGKKTQLPPTPALSRPTTTAGSHDPSPKNTLSRPTTSASSHHPNPKKHVFVPRQIKAHGLIKKPRDKLKKLVTAPSLSPLAEESEESKDSLTLDKAIPLAGAIQPTAMETGSELEREVEYGPAQLSIEQPGRIIGPMLPSPQPSPSLAQRQGLVNQWPGFDPHYTSLPAPTRQRGEQV